MIQDNSDCVGWNASLPGRVRWMGWDALKKPGELWVHYLLNEHHTLFFLAFIPFEGPTEQ